MPARKAKAPARKHVTAKKVAGPKYVCSSCGVEVLVTSSHADVAELICCGQVMQKKR